jgi:enoyl-CoA hydratase
MRTLRVDRDERVAVVTLTQPDRLNAIGRDTLTELDTVLTELRDDRRVGALVITGEGRAFSAGANIDELSDLDGPDAFADFVHFFTDVLDRLEQHSTPSIAAIDGVAFGGGLELALACDLRVASDRARLGVPEIKLGLLPGAGGTQRLPRLIPRGVATQMLLTGEPLSALDAYRLGLVNELSGDAPALPTALALARTVAAAPVGALAAAKRLVRQGVELPLPEAIVLERATVSALFASDDATEGLGAFREKRAPEFRDH